MNKTDRSDPAAPAVGTPLDCGVGRLVPERVSAGDTVECDVCDPQPQTHRLTLLTPEATAFTNELLARPNSPWRKSRGCHECAWGKVAGCWRCGSR